MLEYDRTDVSEGIDINKTTHSLECRVCQNWYFLEINCSYQLLICNACHDLLQKFISFVDLITILMNNEAKKKNLHENKGLA